MDRRDILRKCGAIGVAGGLGLLAGCAGGGDDPGDGSESASLKVTDFDYEEGDSGNLVVTVTIENSGDSEGTGHLYVTVTAAETTSETEDEAEDGDDTGDSNDGDATGETTTEDDNDTVASRESREVTVPGGETTTLEIPFEFTVEQFERKGSLEVDLRS